MRILGLSASILLLFVLWTTHASGHPCRTQYLSTESLHEWGEVDWDEVVTCGDRVTVTPLTFQGHTVHETARRICGFLLLLAGGVWLALRYGKPGCGVPVGEP